LGWLPEMVETRFRLWGWDYALTPEGLKEISERVQGHRESTYIPLLDAALSRAYGRHLKRHIGADNLADKARALDIKPTMTPEEGDAVIWNRHRAWYMTPALAGAIPEISPDEHARFGDTVDELEREFCRLVPPKNMRGAVHSLEEWEESQK